MRRSLGTKPPTIPIKRMRQSQEGAGAGQAPGTSRLSRSSAAGPGAMSSGKRVSSMSRLPLPASTTGKKRSSSSDNRVLAERNRNLVTPSNGSKVMSRKDQFTTPQRMSMAPQSRMSLAGTASKRMSGRSSQMGIQKVKDSRPLTDKTYQREQTVKLLDFLRANGYGNMALTTKNFPLSGKEFVNIFNFLYSFLDPATVNRPVIPTVKFEETVVKIMKDLHYPGNIAKSNFVALGSSHAWPTVLGTLEYLLNLAKIYSTKLLPVDNFNAIAFPSVDEDGLPMDRTNKNKIELDFYLECFQKFNSGEDEDYDEETARLKQTLMENQDVNVEYLRSLEKQRQQLTAEHDEVSSKTSNIEDLLAGKNEMASDKAKLEQYVSNLQKRIEEKQLELAKYPMKQEALVEIIHAIRVDVEELRTKCANPGTNHLEAQKNNFIINEKRAMIDRVKDEAEEVNKHCWDQEMKIAKVQSNIADIIRKIDSKAVEANIRTDDGNVLKLGDFKLSEVAHYEAVKVSLMDAVKAAKGEHRAQEKEVAKGETFVEERKEKLASRKRILHEKKLEVSSVAEEIARTKQALSTEEGRLDERLAEARKQLLDMKAEERGGYERLEAEVEAAKVRLEEAKRRRVVEGEKGKRFLEKVMERTLSYFEQCEAIEKDASTSLVEEIRKKVSEVKLTAKEIEEKCSKHNL